MERGMVMFTISSILQDINRHCAINNMLEDRFTYRIIYYVNEDGIGTKHYIDTAYGDLRKTLEGIIKNNLSLTNTVAIAQTTIRKNKECICLQSRSYMFNLNEYFQLVTDGRRNRGKSENKMYGQICCGKY